MEAKDLYVSQRTNVGWSRAKNMGSLINTSAEQGGAHFSRDGRYFFYSQETRTNPEEDGIWSIYFIDTERLNLAELFK